MIFPTSAVKGPSRAISGTDPKQPLILLVDDQPAIRNLCAASLDSEYRLLEAADGQEALQLLFQHKPDLVLLDLKMPVLDGWETLRRIRELASTPVILLTAYGDDHLVVRGLEEGAQGFIVKPFSPLQLAAHVRATLRDSATAPTADEQLSFDEGRLVVDVGRRLAVVRDREVKLSATEYKLLLLLARHAGHVLSVDQILESVWGPMYRGELDYVKTYAGLIRRKIELDPARPRYLRSRRGQGYFLDV